eukprot:gene20553-biopygen2585
MYRTTCWPQHCRIQAVNGRVPDASSVVSPRVSRITAGRDAITGPECPPLVHGAWNHMVPGRRRRTPTRGSPQSPGARFRPRWPVCAHIM